MVQTFHPDFITPLLYLKSEG